MKQKALLVLAIIVVASVIPLLIRGLATGPTDPVAARKSELALLLKALQWQAPPPKDPDYDTRPNPGWYNPKNRQALASFVAKYPNTEEACLGGVWFLFAKLNTDASLDMSALRRRRAEDGEALRRIIIKTASPGTQKIAKIIRASALLDADQHAELKIEVDEILSKFREYETEIDEQFLRFAKVSGVSPMEFEPYLRRIRVISECHQGHLKEALVLAEELQAKYPAWSKRELVNNDIHMLKLGRSPYPTWEEFKNARPNLQELKKRRQAPLQARGEDL